MRSLTLVGYEVANCAGRIGDGRTAPGSFGYRRRNYQAIRDELVQQAWLIKADEAGNGASMISDGHLFAGTGGVDVAAQMITQLSDANFHLLSMALLLCGI